MEIERPGESGGSIPLSAAEQSSRGPCVGRWVTQSCRWKIWEQVKTASTSVGRKKESVEEEVPRPCGSMAEEQGTQQDLRKGAVRASRIKQDVEGEGGRGPLCVLILASPPACKYRL